MVKKDKNKPDFEELKNELIETIAHEFRTPETLIKGYINLVLDSEGDKLSVRAKNYLKLALAGVERLINLTDSFLELLELENQEGVLKKAEPCSINKIIEPIVEDYLKIAHNRGIIFSFKPIKDKKNIKVIIHRNLISEVIKHLIENALKFTEKGKIEIGVKKIKENSNNYLLIYVTDTGIGISKEQQKLIFNKLVQINRKLYQKPGLGLGLYLCRLIIEKHGGKIWVESKLGQGSIFQFTLPIK
ncbi:MAG: sensor histidine kinase [Minisyncoccia bacterium]